MVLERVWTEPTYQTVHLCLLQTFSTEMLFLQTQEFTKPACFCGQNVTDICVQPVKVDKDIPAKSSPFIPQAVVWKNVTKHSQLKCQGDGMAEVDQHCATYNPDLTPLDFPMWKYNEENCLTTHPQNSSKSQ
jgi:hypothetical protein